MSFFRGRWLSMKDRILEAYHYLNRLRNRDPARVLGLAMTVQRTIHILPHNSLLWKALIAFKKKKELAGQRYMCSLH